MLGEFYLPHTILVRLVKKRRGRKDIFPFSHISRRREVELIRMPSASDMSRNWYHARLPLFLGNAIVSYLYYV